MLTTSRKYELWSIFLLGSAFIVFTIAIPVFQDIIDSKTADYSGYKFNLQQAALKHAEFITTYDNGHFLDIILQEKVVSEKHVKALTMIQDRLMLRCQELLADATIAVWTDPSDKSDDSISRHVKFRHTPLKELRNIFDTYVGPTPTSIGHKFVVDIRRLNRWKIFFYCAGSVLFIFGTFLQFGSKQGKEPTTNNLPEIPKKRSLSRSLPNDTLMLSQPNALRSR